VQTLNTQFEFELKKRITEEVDRIKDNLAAGLAVTDYAQYQNQVGRIAALQLVVGNYCEEVTTTINER
jgi:hypothetical protein